MKKIGIFLFVFLISSIFNGCKKETVSPEPEPEPENPEQTYTEHIKLKSGVYEITDEQREYIDSVFADTVLVFNTSTPNSIIPENGNIIVQTKRSENIPNGFLGKVNKIEKEEGGIWVITSPEPLENVFDEFRIEGELDFMPDEHSSDKNSRIIYGEKDEDGFYCITHYLNLGYEYKEEDKEKKGNNNNDDDKTKNIDYEINSKLNVGIKMLATGDITKGNAHYIVLLKISNESLIEIVSKSEFKPDLLGVKLPFTPVGVFTPTIIIEPIVFLKGELDLNAGHNYKKIYVLDFVQKKDGWENGNYKWPDTTDSFSIDKASVKGSCGVGISGDFKLRIFGIDNLSLGFEASGILTCSGEFDLSSSPTNKYELLKDVSLEKSFDINLNGYVHYFFRKINIFPITHPLWKENLYVLPEFYGMYATANKAKKYIEVSTNVKRDLLFKDTQINIDLYDETGQPVKSNGYVNYYKEREFPSPWNIAFTELYPGYYRAYPKVKIPMFPNDPIFIPEYAEATISNDNEPLIGAWETQNEGKYIRTEFLSGYKFNSYDSDSYDSFPNWETRSNGTWKSSNNVLKLILDTETETYNIEKINEDELVLSTNETESNVKESVTMKRLKYVGQWKMTKYEYCEYNSNGNILSKETITDPNDEEWFDVIFNTNGTFQQTNATNGTFNKGNYNVKNDKLYWEPYLGDNTVEFFIENPEMYKMEILFKDNTPIETGKYYYEKFYFSKAN